MSFYAIYTAKTQANIYIYLHIQPNWQCAMNSFGCKLTINNVNVSLSLAPLWSILIYLGFIMIVSKLEFSHEGLAIVPEVSLISYSVGCLSIC